jgi:hypothetical protein
MSHEEKRNCQKFSSFMSTFTDLFWVPPAKPEWSHLQAVEIWGLIGSGIVWRTSTSTRSSPFLPIGRSRKHAGGKVSLIKQTVIYVMPREATYFFHAHSFFAYFFYDDSRVIPRLQGAISVLHAHSIPR